MSTFTSSYESGYGLTDLQAFTVPGIAVPRLRTYKKQKKCFLKDFTDVLINDPSQVPISKLINVSYFVLLRSDVNY
jgi:hypothetical protein